MRLLFVTHQYPPALGGSEKFFSDLAEGLVERGHEVEVATTKSEDYRSWRTTLSSREEANGVRVRRFRCFPRGKLTWALLERGLTASRRSPGLVSDLATLVGSGPVSPGLFRFVRRRARLCDLVHIQTLPYAHVVYASWAARQAGRPVVITPHVHSEQPEIFRLELFLRCLRRADLVQADTGREVECLTGWGVPRERIQEVGIGFRLDAVPSLDPLECRRNEGIPEDAFVVLFLGRKVCYKGLNGLRDAVRLLSERHPRTWLISAGPPGEMGKQSDEPASSGSYRWLDLDRIDEERKWRLLAACDVMALPSVAEAFGVVFLEAWSLGKPVIGARAGATPWLISDGLDGLLVDPGDTAQLAAALERLVMDPDLARWLGRNGRVKTEERYSLKTVARLTEEGYKRVLQSSNVSDRRLDHSKGTGAG